MHPDSPSCPTCKNAISRDKLIPLYGRSKEGKDPRERTPEPIPSRPQAQRGENVRESNVCINLKACKKKRLNGINCSHKEDHSQTTFSCHQVWEGFMASIM